MRKASAVANEMITTSEPTDILARNLEKKEVVVVLAKEMLDREKELRDRLKHAAV